MSSTRTHSADPLMRRLIWRAVGRHLYRWTFHNWYPLRRSILRFFGAQVADDIRFRRTVEIDRPWNLKVGKLAVIGDHALLQCRAPITIGDECTISQMVLLCTEIRDPGQERCPIRIAPIIIEDHCWVAADSMVTPGVHMHEGAVVGARSLVELDIPAWNIVAGQPATIRRKRTYSAGHEHREAQA